MSHHGVIQPGVYFVRLEKGSAQVVPPKIAVKTQQNSHRKSGNLGERSKISKPSITLPQCSNCNQRQFQPKSMRKGSTCFLAEVPNAQDPMHSA